MNATPELRHSGASSPRVPEAEQASSGGGFTAVNGRSPPSWSNGRPRGSSNNSDDSSSQPTGRSVFSPTNGDGSSDDGATHHDRRESESSNKRKRADVDLVSPVSSSSQKRRSSPSAMSHTSTLPPITSGQSNAPPYATQEPDANMGRPPSQHWPLKPSSVDDANPETRLVEALQRDGQQSTPNSASTTSEGQSNYPTQPGQQPSQVMSGSAHGTPTMTSPAFQKQRKRNFANRTKTGCLTCRERKKKCDEGKPTCNNCHRGGFDCKGYSQSNSFLKNALAREHHPIQAKNPGYGAPLPVHYVQSNYIPAPAHYPPPPQPSGPHNAYGRPMTADRDRPRPVQDPNMRPEYSRPPSWHDPYPPPHYAPPEPVRQEHAVLPYADSGREAKKLPPVPSLATNGPRDSSYRDGREALIKTASNALNQHSMGHTEKDKMLNHLPFDPSDAQLKKERHACAVAVHSFNKGCEDPAMLTEHEKRERFRTIIEGKPDHLSKSPERRGLKIGSVGENVDVQAPFQCDYGYNTKIGDNTDIGRNCNIMDACTVRIGSNCTIGPDVSFYSQDGDHYPKVPRLNGQRRLALAKPIYIQDDVFIGGHCIILGGVTIGRGATIGAGTVVKDDVKPGNTTVSYTALRHITGPWADKGSRASAA